MEDKRDDAVDMISREEANKLIEDGKKQIEELNFKLDYIRTENDKLLQLIEKGYLKKVYLEP